MKKCNKILSVFILITALLFISGCGNKNINTNVSNNIHNQNGVSNNSNKQNEDILIIELFYRNGSEYCKKFLNFYDSLDENVKSKIILNKNNFDEIGEDLSNSNPIRKKYNDIVKKLDIAGCGVPFIVFNEEKYMCGFNDNRTEEFMQLVREYIK